MWKPESIGQYHDLWASILLSAPDNFHSFDSEPVDQAKALRDAFDQLRSGFPFARQKLKDERIERIAQELIEMSFEAYSSGDAKTGAHALQECEGLIWKAQKAKVKYGVEAERRAFGANVVYAGVRVSPYPVEGTSADLAPDQAALLELAEGHCRSYMAAMREFKYFAFVCDNEGIVKRISPDPDRDSHPVLSPVQKSWRATYKRLKELAAAGSIRACVLMEVVGPQGSGIVCYDLEQRGRPRISARQLFRLKDGGAREYDVMRFHLDDPQFFPESL